MGVKERGLPDTPVAEEPSQPIPSIGSTPTLLPRSTSTSASRDGSRAVRQGNANGRPVGWMATMSRIVWEKWRWGVFMIAAVLVARFSS